VAELKDVLSQVKKTGFSIQPIYYKNDTHLSFTYQNRKKDFRLVINKKDGGFIGFEKWWEF